uniref:U3 small nucleolar RNA-associated protein NOL7 C-terminal domain-containing protein n=1 Tax=Esox lucius TaxID=8010 RepID=A0A3P8YNE1_ESOLU
NKKALLPPPPLNSSARSRICIQILPMEIYHGNASSKKVNCAKITKEFQLHLDSSDDDGPEEVTFEDSKTSALRSMKEALETTKREKELLKEKRRKRQELFQKQKVGQLNKLGFSKNVKLHKKKKTNISNPFCSRLKGNYSVMRVATQSATKSQQQTAMDFIQSRLYGPGSQRTTTNQLLSLQNKRGQNKSAAVQFVNEKWAKAEQMTKRWIHKQKVPSN